MKNYYYSVEPEGGFVVRSVVSIEAMFSVESMIT